MSQLWLETSFPWKDSQRCSFSDFQECVRQLNDPFTLLWCILLIICLFWWTQRIKTMSISHFPTKEEREDHRTKGSAEQQGWIKNHATSYILHSMEMSSRGP